MIFFLLSTGQTGDEWTILSEPVGKVLHFAGEHTHSTYMGYTHGAYLSGIRAANNIIGENVPAFHEQSEEEKSFIIS